MMASLAVFAQETTDTSTRWSAGRPDGHAPIPVMGDHMHGKGEWMFSYRYMYMNRLRHDDYLAIFESAGHEVLLAKPDVDEQALSLLRQRVFEVDDRFRMKSEHVLSITGSWIVSKTGS